jgi:hypothetical protein
MNNEFDIREFERQVLRSIHPPKPIYRKVGTRKGRPVVEVRCYYVMGRYVGARKIHYHNLYNCTHDTFLLRVKNRFDGFWFRVRKSIPWYLKP